MTVKIGDKVTLQIPQENREWGYNPGPDGLEVEVVGWSEIAYGRLQSYGKEPGIYENHSWPIIKFPDGKTQSIGTWCLKTDSSFYEQESVKLRDLPELPFYEWDEVEVVSPRYSSLNAERERPFKVISGIDYSYYNQKCNDGITPMPMYRVSPDTSGGSYSSFRGDELKLINRGLIWKFYHGEKLEFNSIAEERNLYYALGKYQEVRNPRNDLYKWTKDEMVESAEEGICDCMNISGGLFGSGPHLSAIRFQDRDLGERARKYFIENMKS